jgi:hypothetical protein
MRKSTAFLLGFFLLLAVTVLCWRQVGSQGKTQKSTAPKSPKGTVSETQKTTAKPLDPCVTLPSNIKYFWVSPAEFKPDVDQPTANMGACGTSCPIKKTYQTAVSSGKVEIFVNALGSAICSPPSLVAPLRIPDGATLREIRFAFTDDQPKMDAMFSIFKISHDDKGLSPTSAILHRWTSEGHTGSYVVRDCDLNIQPSSSAYHALEFYASYTSNPANKASVALGGVRFGYTLP